MLEGPVHDRIAKSCPPAAFGDRHGPTRRVQCPAGIREPMFPQLRDLDPGLDGDRARTRGKIEPGGLGLVVSAEAAEHPTALDLDTLDRPGRVQATVDDTLPGRTGPLSPDIWRTPRMPPR